MMRNTRIVISCNIGSSPNLVEGVSKGEISPNNILATEGWKEFLKKHVDGDFFLEWDESLS